MRRRILNLAALLSMLLCAATVVLWLRNIHSEEQLIYFWRNRMTYLGVCAGRVLIAESRGGQNAQEDLGPRWQYDEQAEPLPQDGRDDVSASYHTYAWHGFSYEWNASGPNESRILTVPAPLAAIGFLLLPAWRVWHILKDRPSAEACENCGYNLTGNLSGTCPECGTPAAKPPFFR